MGRPKADIELGFELSRLRRDRIRPFTQAMLAKESGIDVRTINQIEKGSLTTRKTALKIARALDFKNSEELILKCRKKGRNKEHKTYLIDGITIMRAERYLSLNFPGECDVSELNNLKGRHYKNLNEMLLDINSIRVNTDNSMSDSMLEMLGFEELDSMQDLEKQMKNKSFSYDEDFEESFHLLRRFEEWAEYRAVPDTINQLRELDADFELYNLDWDEIMHTYIAESVIPKRGEWIRPYYGSIRPIHESIRTADRISLKWTDPKDSEIENLGILLDCIEQLNSDLNLDFRKLIKLENSFWKGIRSIEEKGFLAFFREWNNEDLNYAEVCILKMSHQGVIDQNFCIVGPQESSEGNAMDFKKAIDGKSILRKNSSSDCGNLFQVDKEYDFEEIEFYEDEDQEKLKHKEIQIEKEGTKE